MSKKTVNDAIEEAERATGAGRHDLAAAAYRGVLAAVGAHPAASQIRMRLGLALLRDRQYDNAAEVFGELNRSDPTREVRFRLAQAHALAGRRAEASPLIDSVVKDLPEGNSVEIARTASLLQQIGRDADAGALLDAALARGLRDLAVARAFTQLAIGSGRVAEALDLLAGHTRDASLPPGVRGELLFSRARLLDWVDRTDEAWDACVEANRLTRRPFDADAYDARTDRLIETFTADAVRSIARPGDEGGRAVLIVGLPRSGTTLVERQLGTHPGVAIGGELRALRDAACSIPGTDATAAIPPLNRVRGTALARVRRGYLAALEGVSRSADRVTDKMPQNFELLGLVPAILPGAAVVHCRRDLRDTALSCFFRGFIGGNSFSHDLRDIARFFRAYLRLMRHWERVLPEAAPGVRLLEAGYEAMSAQPDAETGRLIRGLGLPGDGVRGTIDDVGTLSPTLELDQVGRGVYTSSVQRWRRYEQRIAPFIEAMGDDLSQ